MARQVLSQSPVACISTKGSSEEMEPNLNFFTERDTRLIYEASFYEDFVLVRPASPLFYSTIRQLTWHEFNAEFEDFWGDRVYLRKMLDGEEADPDDVQII